MSCEKLLKFYFTESAPGNTTKQNGSCFLPIKTSWASGRVHLLPHTGRINVSGSISDPFLIGVQ